MLQGCQTWLRWINKPLSLSFVLIFNDQQLSLTVFLLHFQSTGPRELLFILISPETLAVNKLTSALPGASHRSHRCEGSCLWGGPCHLYFLDNSWLRDLTLLTSMWTECQRLAYDVRCRTGSMVLLAEPTHIAQKKQEFHMAGERKKSWDVPLSIASQLTLLPLLF